MSRNPFIDDSIVGAADYCPRRESEKYLLKKIRNGHNVALIGDRRIGKSSTTHHVIDETNYLKIAIDLYHIRDDRDLAKAMIEAITNAASQVWDLEKIVGLAKNFRPYAVPDPESPLGFKVSAEITAVHYEESLNTAFELLSQLAKRKKNKIVVFFDEFQSIRTLRNSEAVLRFMRGKIQQFSRIAFVYAGSIRKDMEELFRSHSSAFFKQAEVYYFDRIEAEVFFPFIKERFQQKKIKLSQSVFRYLFELTYGVTGDVQTFCRVAFDYLPKGVDLNFTHFFAVMEKIYHNEKKYFEQILDGKELTKKQSLVLTYLPYQDRFTIHSQAFRELAAAKSAGTISKALQKLLQKEYIYQHEQEYRFTNPFFKEWILDYRAYLNAGVDGFRAGMPLRGTRLDFGYRLKFLHG